MGLGPEEELLPKTQRTSDSGKNSNQGVSGQKFENTLISVLTHKHTEYK